MNAVEIQLIDLADAESAASYAGIHNAATPEDPESVENLRWARATYPDTHRWLARLDGRPVGAATTGRIYVHPPEYDRYWLGIRVLPDARRRGVGSALFAAVSAIARAAGKHGFETIISEVHADGLAFLARRGFVEAGRMRAVRLALGDRRLDAGEPPEGIELATFAARPELVPELYGVAAEAFPDIPSGGAPIDPGTLEEFLGDIHRPGLLAAASIVAVERATGRAVGYAVVQRAPGSVALAWNDMTAVRPAFRGRGIATAMKLAAIAAAAELGVEELRTTNDEENAAMRAVNRALGYVPAPDVVELVGPLAGERSGGAG